MSAWRVSRVCTRICGVKNNRREKRNNKLRFAHGGKRRREENGCWRKNEINGMANGGEMIMRRNEEGFGRGRAGVRNSAVDVMVKNERDIVIEKENRRRYRENGVKTHRVAGVGAFLSRRSNAQHSRRIAHRASRLCCYGHHRPRIDNDNNRK